MTLPRLSLVLGLAALAVPVAAYFWFIDRFSVNVVYGDQWSDVSLLDRWYSGNLAFGDLWAAHGDHRILFPNLIVLGLAQFTHLNVVVEEYVSAVMLVAATVFIVAAHRRRSPSTPFIWYLPVVLLLFSFVQFQNTLWGFQMAWFLVTLSLAAALYFLDRPVLTQVAFAAALVATVVASYSSLQGLVVWPAGLLLLYLRRRSSWYLLVWSGLAVIVALVYFYNLKLSGDPDQTWVFTHPIASLKFFLFLIGSVLGVQLTNAPGVEVALGAAIVVVSVWLIAQHGHRDERSSRPLGVALIFYGLLFAATITQGRAWFGFWAPSRYSTCGLLILGGCYLVLIDRSAPGAGRRNPPVATSDARAASDGRSWQGWYIGWHSGHPLARIIMSLAICATVVYGTGHGYASAKSWSTDQQQVADATVNYLKATPSLLETELVKAPPTVTRALAQTAAEHQLSVFDTGNRSLYARVGLLPALVDVRTTMVDPGPHATLSGIDVLHATALDLSGVRGVQFLATNRSGQHVLIGSGKLFDYVWFSVWNTRTIPNGRYDLVSVATGDPGTTARSSRVAVTVRNSLAPSSAP